MYHWSLSSLWDQALRSAWTKVKVNCVLKTLNLSRVQNPRGWGRPLKMLPSEPTHVPFSERPAAIPAFDWPLCSVPGGCRMLTPAWQPQVRRLRRGKMRGLAWVTHWWDWSESIGGCGPQPFSVFGDNNPLQTYSEQRGSNPGLLEDTGFIFSIKQIILPLFCLSFQSCLRHSKSRNGWLPKDLVKRIGVFWLSQVSLGLEKVDFTFIIKHDSLAL